MASQEKSRNIQSINQLINQSIIQSTNQSINQLLVPNALF